MSLRPAWMERFKIDEATWETLCSQAREKNTVPLVLALEMGLLNENKLVEFDRERTGLASLKAIYFKSEPPHDLFKEYSYEKMRAIAVLPVLKWNGCTYFAKPCAEPVGIESEHPGAVWLLAPWSAMARWFQIWSRQNQETVPLPISSDTSGENEPEKEGSNGDGVGEQAKEAEGPPSGIASEESTHVFLQQIDFGNLVTQITNSAIKEAEDLSHHGLPEGTSSFIPIDVNPLGRARLEEEAQERLAKLKALQEQDAHAKEKRAQEQAEAEARLPKPPPEDRVDKKAPQVGWSYTVSKQQKQQTNSAVDISAVSVSGAISFGGSQPEIQNPTSRPQIPDMPQAPQSPHGDPPLVPWDQAQAVIDGAPTPEQLVQATVGLWKNHFTNVAFLWVRDKTLLGANCAGTWKKYIDDKVKIPMNGPSVFKIAVETGHAYHGYVVPSATNDQFFKAHLDQYPEHVTVAPVATDEGTIAIIVGGCTKGQGQKIKVAMLEEVTRLVAAKAVNLGSALAKAG